MRPEKPRLVSSTGRTSPLRTIRLDLCFDFFGHHGRHSGWNHLLPGGLHLSDTNCRKLLAHDRFERAGIKQALGGGLLGEGVRSLPLPLKPAAEVWINPPENRPQVRTLELPRDSKIGPQVSQSH